MVLAVGLIHETVIFIIGSTSQLVSTWSTPLCLLLLNNNVHEAHTIHKLKSLHPSVCCTNSHSLQFLVSIQLACLCGIGFWHGAMIWANYEEKFVKT